jgi:hypothetical protein
MSSVNKVIGLVFDFQQELFTTAPRAAMELSHLFLIISCGCFRKELGGLGV